MTIQIDSEDKKVLELIVAASEEFLQSTGSKLNYQKITDDILYISGAKYAGFDLYDEDGTKFTTVALSAPEGIIKKAYSLLGFRLLGKRWDHDFVRAEKIKLSTITHFSSLHELTGDVISGPLVYLLEQAFNIGEVILVKILKENTMVGSFTLIMPKSVRFKNDEYVEIYTRQAGLLIERSRSEARLVESEKQLRSVFAAVSDPIFLLDKKTGDILDVNDAACSLYGYSRDEILQLKNTDMSAEPDETRKALEKSLTLIPVRYHKKKDGTVFPVEITASLFELNGSKVSAVSIRDITERKKAEVVLKKSEARLHAILNSTPFPVALVDINDDTIDYWSRSARDLFGHVGNTTKEWYELAYPDPEYRREVIKRWKPFLEKARLSGKAVNTGEYNVTCRNGSVRICELYATFLADTLVVTFNDITGRKKAEQEILDISFHDQLTGLYNRRFFEEELKRLDTKRQFPLSIIMGDLNGLKLINDVFGHLEGDRLLKKSAEILKKASRSDDILARWGGDEFIILLPKTSTADTEEIVQRIKNECKKTNSQKIPMSLSIGAAQKETTAQDMKAVVMDAENNMYRNKLIEKHSITSSIVFALDRALYEKSSETKAHTDRICKLALKLGESIKLHTSQLDELSLLASLHDIGKVAIPEKILLKKGALTEKEWLVIKRHPEIGFNIAQSSPQIAHIAKPILYCHENFDGSGYPLGLKRESIPVISRIILIVDAYDVMTTGRTYKLPVSKDDAIKELRKCAGSLFDPALVDKFIEILSEQKA
jgi:diguanylate cyclase (GGDEF)-like protein/PAS domain S-box-containing protein